ncbi:MAG TPA: hypothetical protein VEA19_07900, partial [Actinomycetota bacterium]|nr:hypothetical protein [Actinomycetota bacterium]
SAPILPLFDGQAPPAAYRWVNPPEDQQTNEPPLPGRQEIDLTAAQPLPLNVTTNDGQAVLTGTQDSLSGAEGEASVVATVTPLDPARLGEPPEGLVFESNAYRFEAEYGSGEPAEITGKVTVVLRYARHATDLLRLDGGRWVPVERATTVPTVLQVFAETDGLGTFAAAAPAPPFNAAPWIAGGLAALAVAGLVVARLRMTRSAGSKRPASKSRPKDAKGKGGPGKGRKRR